MKGMALVFGQGSQHQVVVVRTETLISTCILPLNGPGNSLSFSHYSPSPPLDAQKLHDMIGVGIEVTFFFCTVFLAPFHGVDV
jgi:hypothetical protein